jgi:hypothetical protein
MQSTASSRSLHLGNRDSASDYSRPARLNRENQQGGSRQKVRLTITVRGFLSMHKLFLAYRNWPDEARTDHVSDRIRCMCTKFETRTPSITRPSSNLTTLWPHTTPPCSPHMYVDSGLRRVLLQSAIQLRVSLPSWSRCLESIIISMTS